MTAAVAAAAAMAVAMVASLAERWLALAAGDGQRC